MLIADLTAYSVSNTAVRTCLRPVGSCRQSVYTVSRRGIKNAEVVEPDIALPLTVPANNHAHIAVALAQRLEDIEPVGYFIPVIAPVLLYGSKRFIKE